MSSLLAHLFTRIKGSPENVAVLSLHYILTNSIEARRAFARYMSDVTGISLPVDLWFKTESTGDNLERPDLVVRDLQGNELLVCEAKFWAGLTANQPQGYLQSVTNSSTPENSALVFICPHQRITSLWNELVRSTGIESVPKVGSEDYRCDMVHDIPLVVVSWRSLLETIGRALTVAHSPLAADLQQLQGLCDTMDSKAFIPLNSDDLSVAQAARVSSYYNIIHQVGELLLSDHGATTGGQKATNLYAGYTRYMSWGQYKLSIRFSCEYWQDLAETPFWLGVADRNWTYARAAHQALQHLESTSPPQMFFEDTQYELLLFPLHAPCHVPEGDVTNHLVSSVMHVLQQLP